MHVHVRELRNPAGTAEDFRAPRNRDACPVGRRASVTREPGGGGKKAPAGGARANTTRWGDWGKGMRAATAMKDGDVHASTQAGKMYSGLLWSTHVNRRGGGGMRLLFAVLLAGLVSTSGPANAISDQKIGQFLSAAYILDACKEAPWEISWIAREISCDTEDTCFEVLVTVVVESVTFVVV